MSERRQPAKGECWSSLTSLAMLVAFVFIILLVSFAVSGALLYALVQAELMPKLNNNTFLTLLVFMLFVSLMLGTFIAGLGGTMLMRPLRNFIDATQKVSEGDYTVRVDLVGTYEMERLAHSFNKMTHELASVETLRSDFVHSISHEFKTPVVSIRGFAKLLKKEDLSPEKREEYLDIIIAESDRMSQLSGNILLLSKLDNTAHMPESAPFALDEQLRRVVLLLEPEMAKQQIALYVTLPEVFIDSSEELLQHVWLNLLSNALKFTPPGGSITVTLAETEECATVSVADTGIGMTQEVRRHVFEKFYQGDTSRTTKGNGLGLSLAQHIVQLCGGQIFVESVYEEGSTLTVVLPKA